MGAVRKRRGPFLILTWMDAWGNFHSGWQGHAERLFVPRLRSADCLDRTPVLLQNVLFVRVFLRVRTDRKHGDIRSVGTTLISTCLVTGREHLFVDFKPLWDHFIRGFAPANRPKCKLLGHFWYCAGSVICSVQCMAQFDKRWLSF